MRTPLIAILALAACTTSPDDRLTLDTGKGDTQGIQVPLRLDPKETIDLEVDVDGPFELAAAYDQDADVDLLATDGTAQFHASGHQASLVAMATKDVHATYTITVTNLSATASIKGRLAIRNPRPGCADAAWSAWFDTVAKKLDDANGFIDQNERAVIDTTIAARPCQPTSDTAYAHWFARFVAQLDGTNGFIDQNERPFVDIVSAQRPDATGSEAYRAWVTAYGALVGKANGFIDQNERVYVDLYLGATPRATRDAAYIAWEQVFQPFLAGVNGFIDQNERDILLTLIAGKPCIASTPDAEAAWAKLAAIASSDASAILEASRPAACQ